MGKIKLKALPLICLLSHYFCHFSVLLSPSLPPLLPIPFDLQASMVSPLFSAATSSGSHTLSGLIFLLLPMYLLIPGGWKILVSGPFNIFLPFQFFSFSAFFILFYFTFLDSVFVSSKYFSLLTLSAYPLRKWHIRVLFL